MKGYFTEHKWMQRESPAVTSRGAFESCQLREELRQQKINQETEAAKLIHRLGLTDKRRR